MSLFLVARPLTADISLLLVISIIKYVSVYALMLVRGLKLISCSLSSLAHLANLLDFLALIAPAAVEHWLGLILYVLGSTSLII